MFWYFTLVAAQLKLKTKTKQRLSNLAHYMKNKLIILINKYLCFSALENKHFVFEPPRLSFSSSTKKNKKKISPHCRVVVVFAMAIVVVSSIVFCKQ